MEFRVLGPLEVWANGKALSLGTRKQRTVLALLAVNANHLVSLDELVDELWPELPPTSAVANVRGYVGVLRRLFESVESGRGRIVRRGGGYVFHADPDDLDILAFQADSAAGREAARQGDLKTAATLLAAARERRHGAVAAGISRGPLLEARRVAVEEEWLAVTEHLAELHLALNEPDWTIALLREHVRAHPLRERAQALLMRALHRSGDVAGALAAYADARAALVDELGVEPGSELRELHHMVLSRDVEARLPPPAAPTNPIQHPRELPPGVGYFVGRTTEAAKARAAILPSDRPPRHRAAVVVFYGPGGAGKSALAVRLAHEVADGFPDGQLYVDLLGSTSGLRPLSTIEALHRLLRSLGIREADIPHEVGDASARFRTATADRQLLIVLDNASDTTQLTGLVPASDTSAVLITSRRSLSGMDADRRLRLGGLPAEDGLALLTRLADDVTVSQDTGTRIIELCDHLPLAVRIAAGRFTSRPDLSPEEFVERLADRRRRLDELELDGLAVRSCIRVGYEALASGGDRTTQLAARTFKVLGLLNVPDVQAEVVAAMLGERDATVGRAALDHLVAAGLLEPLPAGRYRLHDLVRLVAAERATEEDDSVARMEALHRGLAYYAGTLRRADRIMRPGRLSAVDAPPPPPDIMLSLFRTPAQAKIWVEAELRSLVAATEQASALADGSRRIALLVGDALWHYLYIRHDWNTARRLALLVLQSAERHGDSEMAAWAHMAVGRSAADFGEWPVAAQNFERALAIQSSLSNFRGVALTLNALGIVLAEGYGDISSAIRRYTECLQLVWRHGMSGLEAVVQNNLSSAYGTVGRWEDALEAAQRSLLIRQDLDDQSSVAATLCNLAAVQAFRGDLTEAVVSASNGIKMSRDAGDQIREHELLLTRCEAQLRRGRYAEAMADAEATSSLASARSDRYSEVLALQQKSKILRATGEQGQAAQLRDRANDALATVRTRRVALLQSLLNQVAEVQAEEPTTYTGG